MISRPTVLILGAGASAPYGFPTGAGLRDLICKPAQPSKSVAKALIETQWWNEEEVTSFTTQLRESGRLSADVFLEYRPDLVPIGKAAMAAALIPSERTDDLFNDLQSNGKWYAHLFDQLDAPPDKWADNKLTVVTYNYDRSLEFFLLTALGRSFDLSVADAERLAATLPVIHLHGFLAKLGPVHEGGRNYSEKLSRRRIQLAADDIRIVSEANPRDSEFLKARDALRAAERVYILGFGYGQVNLDRLGQDCFPDGRQNLGTCYRMEAGERYEAEAWFNGKLSLHWPERDILSFLRHHPPLQMP